MVLSGSYSSFLKDVYAVYFLRCQIAVQKLPLPVEAVRDASPSDDEYHLVVEELGKFVEPARAICLLRLSTISSAFWRKVSVDSFEKWLVWRPERRGSSLKFGISLCTGF